MRAISTISIAFVLAFGPASLLACGSSSPDDGSDAGAGDSSATGDTAQATDTPKGDAPGDARSDVTPETPLDAGPVETVHFIGRFDTSDAAGPKFEWSASAVAARFTGTGIDVKLD